MYSRNDRIKIKEDNRILHGKISGIAKDGTVWVSWKIHYREQGVKGCNAQRAYSPEEFEYFLKYLTRRKKVLDSLN